MDYTVYDGNGVTYLKDATGFMIDEKLVLHVLGEEKKLPIAVFKNWTHIVQVGTTRGEHAGINDGVSKYSLGAHVMLKDYDDLECVVEAAYPSMGLGQMVYRVRRGTFCEEVPEDRIHIVAPHHHER